MKTKFALLLLGLWLGGGLLIALRAQTQDFGDAPAPYPTVQTANGARHVATGPLLGSLRDAETDGQPNANATGDDLSGAAGDDEDGVFFLTPLTQGLVATVRVVCTMGPTENGKLDAWVDFNNNLSWADAGEKIFPSVNVVNGLNTLNFTVPAGATAGTTFARFRLSRAGGLNFDGLAADGEVEDYQVSISAPLDFGDAPTNNYPTLLAQNGARHTVVSSFCLGPRIDAEVDGQPNGLATGDDVNPPTADDEDGVTLPGPPGLLATLDIGQVVTAQVFLTAPAGQNGLLNAWVDFNRDGDWADSFEQIASNVSLSPGNNNVNFLVPVSAFTGTTFARFRLSHQTVSYDGFGQDGEVEDYAVNLTQALDFGDAPSPYPTMLAVNGARHTILPGFYLGSRVDGEGDGQPDANATGDDLNGPDEDGVAWSGPLIQGRPNSVTVTASQEGLLYAWVDFNANGSWADGGEQIAAARALLPGPNVVTFNVPPTSHLGKTFARFRFTHQSSLSFAGSASDGEVEDYQTTIIQDRERCDLSCDGFDFWLTFPGNYAPDTDNPVRASLGILGNPGTSGTVTVSGLGFAANFTIPATRAAYVPLPAATDLGDLNDAITNKGIHVVSSASVRVTAFNQVHYTTDSYLGLNSSIIGTSYIILGLGNEHTGVPPLNGTQFALVGTETNTLVRIVPSVATLGHPAGVPFYVTLQPGDCYQLRNTNDAPADLSGTLVKSDKPIGVFGSHQVANIPSTNTWFADYVVEQLLPVNTWGNDFYTAPLATRSNGDTFRCLAAQNGTTVFLNGAALAVLNAGQFKEAFITNASRITADKPIFVAQYANSSDWDGVVNADPFMLTVQATRHYVNSYIVTTPTNDFAANYLHLIAPTSAVASVLVDGAAVGAFTPIAGTTYAFRRHPVALGAHTVTAGAPISVSVYGWAEYESYGHPGCFFVGDVLPPTVSTAVPGATASVNDHPNTPGFVPTPNVASGTQVKDNCDPQPSTPTQTPIPGTLLPPGVHNIALAAQDSLGNIGLAEFTFTVLDPSPVIISCPSNILVNCGSNNGAIVNFAVTAHSTYDPNVPVLSTPSSGSFFPDGTTVVTNIATSLAGQSNSCSFTVTVLCDNRLEVVLRNNSLFLSWSGIGSLEFASKVTGPWSNVVSGVSFYNTPATGQQGFFRVRH